MDVIRKLCPYLSPFQWCPARVPSKSLRASTPPGVVPLAPSSYSEPIVSTTGVTNMQRSALAGRLYGGFSLIETMMVTAVVAVTAGALLPDFSKMQQRHRLEGMAAQLQTEMQFARSQAVAEREAVRFSFRAEAGRSCYVIHTGNPGGCVCSGESAACAGDAKALRSVGFDDDRGLRITSNVAAFSFDPTKGTVTPTATVTVANAQGDAVKLVVNVMGRVRSCTATGLRGYKPC